MENETTSATVAATRARLGYDDNERNEIVCAALTEVGMAAPADPDRLARALGLRVNTTCPARECAGDGCGAGALVGDLVIVCRGPDRAFTVAHEIGHWLARRAGIEPSVPAWEKTDAEHRRCEDGADFMACAILDGGRR